MLGLLTASAALHVPTAPAGVAGRRQALALGVSLALNTLGPQPAPAAEADEQVALYFGAGCFWHVQHEFTLHEQATLARRGAEISATSGYAGGTRLGDKSRVCYHNMQQLADYGALGHGEVVQVTIPASAVGSFSEKFFGIFGKQGIRHDPQDRGGEVRARTVTRATRIIHLPAPDTNHAPAQYRSLLGLKGGMKSPYFPTIREAAANSPMLLAAGRGDEGDTIKDKKVLVYDSDAFPFYPAELYHQFHNDFQGAPYGSAYNALQTVRAKAGAIGETGCPERMF